MKHDEYQMIAWPVLNFHSANVLMNAYSIPGTMPGAEDTAI